jgi:hypothetical protein
MKKTTVLLSIIGGVVGVIALLALALGTPQALARSITQGGAPALISYQGYLSDSSGEPISGTVDLRFELYADAEGGSALWSETQSNVAVGSGYFAAMLGEVTPLSASDFDSTTRYLQVSVDTGDGFTDLPRQRLASVPYALQSEEAKQAASADAAPWSGLSGVPDGFADDSDDDTLAELSCGDGQVAKWDDTAGQWACDDDDDTISGEDGYGNVIVVAKSGGDYDSVAEALNSITSPSADNRYQVWVAPGVYTETQLAQVQGYVHLQGAGPNATVIKSARTNTVQNSDAATAQLDDNGRISDVSIVNEGTGTYGIAIYSFDATRDTFVDNVVAEARGEGGTGHFAMYLNDSEPTIQNSTLKASGASGTAVNAALGSVNATGGFPQALVMNSILIGGGNNDKENCTDNTGTGFGLQLRDSSPNIRDSYICGGHRGIAVYINGHVIVQNSNLEVSSNTEAYLFEISSAGSISLASTGVTYFSPRKLTGAGTGLRCVHTYDNGTFLPLTDGSTSASACD